MYVFAQVTGLCSPLRGLDSPHRLNFLQLTKRFQRVVEWHS
jgi:hypothetical protein